MEVKSRIENYTGEFVCEQIGHSENVKSFRFHHTYELPNNVFEIPDIGDLRWFYSSFSALTLYFNEETGESALYIGSPDQWEGLNALFSDWIDIPDENERAEILPDWIESRIVLGEIPETGNYVMMPCEGLKAGCVFEFDHDGFEFDEEAPNLKEYIEKYLEPDDEMVSRMASYMAFMGDDPWEQWYIKELRRNDGKIVHNK